MPLEVKYFVLKPRAKGAKDVFARASQLAMQEYGNYLRARSVEPELAGQLIAWADDEHLHQLALAQPESEQQDEPDAGGG